MKIIFLLLFAISTVVGMKAWSQDATSAPYDEAKETELAQKAKKRIYPGGKDEDDLKVQAQLVTPVRKLSSQAEVKEEPAGDE